MVRVNGKLMPMAHISGDGEVEWLDHNLGNDAVREALDTFIVPESAPTELQTNRVTQSGRPEL